MDGGDSHVFCLPLVDRDVVALFYGVRCQVERKALLQQSRKQVEDGGCALFPPSLLLLPARDPRRV